MKFTITALATLVASVSALGINCRGSGLCPGNDGILGSAQAQLRGLDQNKKFSDGQHLTCVQSSVSIGNPDLCIFYQKTGRQWTAGQAVQHVQELIDHGCKACGSVPVDAGNNVNNGELTANMVTNGSKAAPLADNQHYLAKSSLGINCRGSSICVVGGIGDTPAGTAQMVRDAIAAGPEGQWSNGQQIACVPHVTGRLCAFYQNIGGRSFSKEQSVNYADQILGHGCRVCGSVPTDSGNNVANGELTINYVD